MKIIDLITKLMPWHTKKLKQ